MSIDLSLIIPTLNEAANLPELVRRIDATLRAAGRSYELIVVDDGSTDGTPDAARGLDSQYPVRIIERGRGAEGGLSGAVLAGFAQARGAALGVIDADLQHPPEVLPAMLALLADSAGGTIADSPTLPPGKGLAHGAEMVVGSRYVSGGRVAERWGAFRKINSRAATLLARPFAAGVSDPMSGFFALPRHVYERGRHLSPLGYKILLELMCKCRPRPVAEVPIHFGQRRAGQSKLTLREQFRYLEHLSRLYDYTFPHASPIVKFVIVVTLAWSLGGLAFALLLRPLDAVAAIGVAYGLAILVAAVFHLRYVRTQWRFLVRPAPWRDFFVSALAEWLTAVSVAWYLAARMLDPPPWELFLIPFTAATFVRYLVRKELLLDVRGLRPEERLAGLIDPAGSPHAETNALATEQELERMTKRP